MLHQVIETLNARVALRSRYDNFIAGKWVAPVDGGYFDNISSNHRQAGLSDRPLAGRR
jgi:aldehyde dehydrogenase